MIPPCAMLVLLGVASVPDATIVVGIGSSKAVGVRVAQRIREERRAGHEVLSQKEMLAGLIGDADARDPDMEALAAVFEDAHEREARFDNTGALGLRMEVLKVYEHTPRPTPRLHSLAARTLHALAFASLAEGAVDAATRWAREASRRFPETTPDPVRYSPDARAFYEGAAASLKAIPTGQLVVDLGDSRERAEVLVDGRRLGNVRDGVESTLPVGRYRVWVASKQGMSFPHVANIQAGATTRIAIDASFERCVRLSPSIRLTCSQDWNAHLRALMGALGAGRAVAIVPAANGKDRVEEVLFPPSEDSAKKPLRLEPPESTYPRFSISYLVPFGAGQLAQERYVFGGTYLAASVGLIVWQIASRVRFAEVNDGYHVAQAQDAAEQIDLSFWLIVGTAVVTVAEALIVGSLFGGATPDSGQHR